MSNLESCANAGAPGALRCAWTDIRPMAVVDGGNVILPATTCTTGNANQILPGYYDLGSGKTMAMTIQCQCR